MGAAISKPAPALSHCQGSVKNLFTSAGLLLNLAHVTTSVVVVGPCDFSVSPSPFGLDFGTLDFGLTIGLKGLTSLCHYMIYLLK